MTCTIEDTKRNKEMELNQSEENILEQFIRSQPFGTMVLYKNIQINLIPFETYKGNKLGCQRKIVDHLDQVTIWRNKTKK